MSQLKCPFSRPAKSFLCLEKCTFRKPESLTDCVECYKMHRLRAFHATLHLFAGESDKDLKLKYAVQSICPICKKHHPHQSRIGKVELEKLWDNISVDLNEFWNNTSKKRRGLDKVEKRASFETLYDNLHQLICEKCGYVDPQLLIYDIALRISVIKGALPEEQVYLHSGALDGYKILMGKKLLYTDNSGCGVVKPRVTIGNFPEDIKNELTAYEIEDFLCHCQECFKHVPPKKGA